MASKKKAKQGRTERFSYLTLKRDSAQSASEASQHSFARKRRRGALRADPSRPIVFQEGQHVCSVRRHVADVASKCQLCLATNLAVDLRPEA